MPRKSQENACFCGALPYTAADGLSFRTEGAALYRLQFDNDFRYCQITACNISFSFFTNLGHLYLHRKEENRIFWEQGIDKRFFMMYDISS